MIQCRMQDCNSEEEQLHHIIPKAIEGTDKDGRVYLCHKHHMILQLMILPWVWHYLPKSIKEIVWNSIVKKTGEYLKYDTSAIKEKRI